jgi:hypothetical protein
MGPPRDKQVALSTFSYVFSELVQYQTRGAVRKSNFAAHG